MTDIFISTVSEPLSTWIEAFPNAELTATAPQHSDDSKDEDLVFWVHQNDVVQTTHSNRLKWLSAIIRYLNQHHPTAKLVVISNQPSQAESLSVIRLGVCGYCHAYTAPDALIEIRSVIVRGGTWVGQDILQLLIQEATKRVGNSQSNIDEMLAKVTKREKEVALQVSKGLTNKEIARALNITERTVKAHLAKVFEALAVKDRLQLALLLNKK